MLITKIVNITMIPRLKKYYNSKGYNYKIGEKFDIKVEDLPNKSNKVVTAKCDICGKVKDLKYQSYMTNTKDNTTYYACSSKCAWDKNRETNLDKYGVEVVTQLESVINKSKQTMLEKYGIDSYSKTKEYKEKFKKSNLERYGVENPFQSEEIKKKIQKTNLEKYGETHHFKNSNYKDKYLYDENNPSYIDGRSKEYNWRNGMAKALKKEIFSERSRVCLVCGKTKRKMVLHHLYSRNKYPELIYDKNNLVILCKDCHDNFHRKYGFGDNTYSQFKEYLESQSTIENTTNSERL